MGSKRMSDMEQTISQLSADEKSVFYRFVSFPDYFSIDWFPASPASKIFAVIRALADKQWILPDKDRPGYYSWSPSFPRKEATEHIAPEELSRMYRNAANIIQKALPESDENILLISKLCFLAELQAADLEICLRSAVIQEKRHKIPCALAIYDSMLKFMENMFSGDVTESSAQIWPIFLKAIERRVSLSIFDLSLKKTECYLETALPYANKIHDKRAQALLELMIGQHNWMSFKHKEAIQHFDACWDILTRTDDEALYRRALKLKGMAFMIRGQYPEAIESYERSLGELEAEENDNFSHLAALMLALCYVQVGMPQRGLGISERIQNRCKKTRNHPLLAFALIVAGIIFLEIRNLKTSRSYFQSALEIADRESLPTPRVVAGIGLSSIECLEGNYDKAAEHYKVLLQARKSSWFYFINIFPYIETSYTIHAKSSVQPVELKPHLDYLNQQKEEIINPLLSGLIQRLQLGLPDNTMSLEEKIGKLFEIENSMVQIGASLELARVRIELAGLLHQNRDWEKAKDYANQAYDFFQPFAPDNFPANLRHLIAPNKTYNNDKLLGLIIEMADALTEQEHLELLLTNIITSISRLTGAERAALFIKEKSSELRLAASRNFLMEETHESSFKESLAAINSSIESSSGEIVQYSIDSHDPVDIRQVIISPLRSGKRIIGALYQDSRFFSIDTDPENMKLLSALACQIGIAIDRAQAYDEIARLNKRLIQEKLYYLEEKEEFRPFGEIIGKCAAVQSLCGLIRQVAPTNSAVLIYGETGVGKELVARAIHRECSRKEGPFIRVNCAALSDSLIDSELFGHERGAFTGAIRTKAGRFELANQGTIFLDEISELPLPTQSKLLRVIQEKEFQRVGGTKILHSDFRLITATNKDLQQEVSANRFREDLFYRLNVFPIFVPPLRERKDDIPNLAMHFLNLFCSQNKKQIMGIPESEMVKLQNYSWPGNIRELSNMIERAVISGSPIRFPELEDVKPIVPDQTKGHKLDNIVKDVERQSILNALEKTRGKVSGKDGAATLLGMNRSALIHRMRKLGIQIVRNPRNTD